MWRQASNKRGTACLRKLALSEETTTTTLCRSDTLSLHELASTFISITDRRLLYLCFPVVDSRLPIQCYHTQTQMHIRRDIRRCIDTARQDKSPLYRRGLAGTVMSDAGPVANWVAGRMGYGRPPLRRCRKARRSL